MCYRSSAPSSSRGTTSNLSHLGALWKCTGSCCSAGKSLLLSLLHYFNTNCRNCKLDSHSSFIQFIMYIGPLTTTIGLLLKLLKTVLKWKTHLPCHLSQRWLLDSHGEILTEGSNHCKSQDHKRNAWLQISSLQLIPIIKIIEYCTNHVITPHRTQNLNSFISFISYKLIVTLLQFSLFHTCS